MKFNFAASLLLLTTAVSAIPAPVEKRGLPDIKDLIKEKFGDKHDKEIPDFKEKIKEILEKLKDLKGHGGDSYEPPSYPPTSPPSYEPEPPAYPAPAPAPTYPAPSYKEKRSFIDLKDLLKKKFGDKYESEHPDLKDKLKEILEKFKDLKGHGGDDSYEPPSYEPAPPPSYEPEPPAYPAPAPAPTYPSPSYKEKRSFIDLKDLLKKKFGDKYESDHPDLKDKLKEILEKLKEHKGEGGDSYEPPSYEPAPPPSYEPEPPAYPPPAPAYPPPSYKQ